MLRQWRRSRRSSENSPEWIDPRFSIDIDMSSDDFAWELEMAIIISNTMNESYPGGNQENTINSGHIHPQPEND